MEKIETPKGRFDIHRIAKSAYRAGWRYESWAGQGCDGDSPSQVTSPDGKYCEVGDGVSRDTDSQLEFAFGSRFEEEWEENIQGWCWDVLYKLEDGGFNRLPDIEIEIEAAIAKAEAEKAQFNTEDGRCVLCEGWGCESCNHTGGY